MSTTATATAPATTPPATNARSERAQARRESLGLLFRTTAFVIGLASSLLARCAILAIFEVPFTPYDPFRLRPSAACPGAAIAPST